MIKKKEKIEASILLLSYFDTIGFNKGLWEFNYGIRIENINQALIANFTILTHYMSLGGFNHLSIKNWNASDDTLLMMAVTKALLDGGKEMDFIKRYIEIYDVLLMEIRNTGRQTLASICLLIKLIKKKKKYLYK